MHGLFFCFYKYIDTLFSRVYNLNMENELKRTFIEVPLFTKRWKEIGLSDDDLLALQVMLLKNPESGPVMEGTGGIRKVRFALENREKAEALEFAILIMQNMKSHI